MIAHRGASGYRPEHTLAAYELAIEQGADFIEPDLVSTSDGVLVARHENEIGGTTDVAAHHEFADRRTTKTIDGVTVSGWFTEDFTLAELRTIRATERMPELRRSNAAYDGRFAIPTLGEVIELARREGTSRGRTIGVYPEAKHPAYFDSIGLSLEEPFVAVLEANGWRDRSAPVFVQSFDVGNLRELAGRTDVRLVLLVGADGPTAELLTPDGLATIAEYADAIGVEKDLAIPRHAHGALGSSTALIADAHEAGLLVHAWTFRAENLFVPTDLRRGDPADPAFLAMPGDLATELRAFATAGVDGVFADQPDLAVDALAR